MKSLSRIREELEDAELAAEDFVRMCKSVSDRVLRLEKALIELDRQIRIATAGQSGNRTLNKCRKLISEALDETD
jgi:hypothetical protein